jgi:peptidyl-prolyl cis-trans isomerase SurA
MKNHMKNSLYARALACAFSLITVTATLVTAIHTQAEVQQLDEVVAIVNKDVVLRSELNERVREIALRATANGMTLPSIDVLENQVLEHLIIERLQLETAARYDIQISDAQINAAIENMRRSNNLTEEQFYGQLAQEGLSREGLRQKLREDIAIQQVQRGIVQQRIHISEQEIDNFLNSSDGKFWISPEYHLGHILVSLPQAPTSEDLAHAEQRAQELYNRLQRGEGFADLAIAESDGPAALNGGDLGWRRTGELPSLFANIAPDLEPGQVSKPQRSAAGFHILKLYESRGGQETEVVTQNRSRHILIKPSAILTNEEAEAKLANIRQQILDGADFAELAKEHSEDIGSALQGGDLGWANPGQFVPEFEKRTQNLPIGEISEPFQSQFGWHILQVQERREQDMTDEIIRHKARNMLMSRRFEDELQIWQRELRDEAYVVIKLDDAGDDVGSGDKSDDDAES